VKKIVFSGDTSEVVKIS